MPEINMDEYLAELSRYASDDLSGAMTSEEIGNAMGWGECKTHKMIKAFVQAGKLEVVKVPRVAITGICTRVFAYKPPCAEGAK